METAQTAVEIRIVHPITLRQFEPSGLNLLHESSNLGSDSTELGGSERAPSTLASDQHKLTELHDNVDDNLHCMHSCIHTEPASSRSHTLEADDPPGTHCNSTDPEHSEAMPATVTTPLYSALQNTDDFQNLERDSKKSVSYLDQGDIIGEKVSYEGIKQTGYDIYTGDLEHRSFCGSIRAGSSGGDTGGSGGTAPVVLANGRGPMVDEIRFGQVPNGVKKVLGPRQDSYMNGVNMTRAVTPKPEGIGESLAWLKRELMDLRNTDQELSKTLFSLQGKIRDLKNKINQDEADDDDDDSERTDSSSGRPSSSSSQWNGSFSSSTTTTPKGFRVIKEENDDRDYLEIKKPKLDFTDDVVKPTRTADNMNAVNSTAIKGTAVNGTALNGTAVNGTAVNGSAVNGTTVNSNAVYGNSMYGNMMESTAVNHNANGYSRNSNNSLDERGPVLRKSNSNVSRKSVTSDGLRNQGLYEKPMLPPPPPPPTAASPTPSLKSTASSDVVRMKDDSKRDSMSSSSFVSSSSSFASSLEELRLQDLSRDLRSSGRSFDRMTCEEEEEEEEVIETEDVVLEVTEDVTPKDNVANADNDEVDNNGNGMDESTEAARWMDSIWKEATMFS